MIKWLYRLLIRKRVALARITRAMQSDVQSRYDREQFQVRKFNEIWRMAWKNVPFYAAWKKSFCLPEEISSLDQIEHWPVLTKADLRNIGAFKRTDVPCPQGHLMTGGSTGEPVRLPSWDDPVSGASQVLGRAAYGIEPGDRTLLLWGHEHLYGAGLKRKINALKRRCKDWLAGWTRVSAYDLSSDAMHRAYRIFAKVRPKFFIGFSPAVLSFVRQNAAEARKVGSVEVILCTAGPLTQAEKGEIEDFFCGRVCMEYGSVECGIMAYTRPLDGVYEVFWHTHLLQALRQENGEYKNLVTRLTDCYVPLIRYDIGDYLELDSSEDAENARSVLEIKSVKGRPSEMLKFKCGVAFFGALIGDCVKQVPEVVSSQIAVNEDQDVLEIRVTASSCLTADQLELIKNRFDLIVQDADKLSIRVIQVAKLHMTIGGKIPRVVRL